MSEPSKREMPAIAALLLCVLLVAAPVVIGELEELPELKAIGYSVLVGVFMAFLGYLKTDPLEAFSPELFVTTPITGVFAGIVMAFWNVDYANALTWLTTAGVLALIEFAGKAIVRRLWVSPGTAKT